MASNNGIQSGHPQGKFQESDLLDALEGIHAQGSFASFAAIKSCDPQIFVQDIGRINIPLSETQAKQIAAKSHQAPYGKGSETIVDTSVRNTWELNPDQFEIKAPIWKSCLDNILSNVSRELDTTSDISAELYKMLLYEEGAMFKAHTDTEKIPGMFGTLVISLPSSHEGGDVVVTHCGVSKTFKTSEHDMSYASWYSDVSHEVLPVKAGYRWVLTYNLAIDPSKEMPTAEGLDKERRDLRNVLQLWSQDVGNGSREPSPLYYVLAHKYTEANISYQGLKTTDRERVSCLRKMCAELNFDLFLTTLEKKEIGIGDSDGLRYRDYDDGDGEDEEYEEGGHHWIDTVVDNKYDLKMIFDLEGGRVASNMDLDLDQILQEEPFQGEPDKEDYEGYMGNSGPEITHWYRLSALVIVPCEGTIPFLSPFTNKRYSWRPQYPENFMGLCGSFVTQCERSPENKRQLTQLHQILKGFWNSTLPRIWLYGDLLLRVLKISMLANNMPELLKLVFDENEQQVPAAFFSWLLEEHSKSIISTDDFMNGFLHALHTQITVTQQYQAILIINGDVDPTDEIQEIILRAVDECLYRFRNKNLYEDDGPAVFDLAFYYHGFDYLKMVVMPVVEKQSQRTAFILGFLKALHQSMKRKQIPQAEAKPMYERVARLAVKNLDLTLLTSIEKPLSDKFKAKFGTTKTATQYLTYKSVLKFVSTVMSLELEEHLELLTERFTFQAADISEREFKGLWIPLLQMLFTVLEEHKISLSAPRWMQIYQKMLGVYTTTHVGRKPQKATMVRKPVRCSCVDCSRLNQFLRNPDQQVGRFPMGKGRRQHLHTHLDAIQADCTHTTERYGNPQTLVVTKVTTQSEAHIAEWWERRLAAENYLEAFDQEKLRIVLGDQFDRIVSMKELEREDPPAPAPVPAATTAFASSAASSALYEQPALGSTGTLAERFAAREARIAARSGSGSGSPISNSPNVPNPNPLPYNRTSASNALAPQTPSASSPKPPAKWSELLIGRAMAAGSGSQPNMSSTTWRGRGTGSTGGSGSGGGSVSSRQTHTIPNPIAGAKRKHIEVIDLTGDD
ncbi:hypothetical protein AAE478_000131 [Parahypoxylon ruwenzoriense]